MKRLLAGFLILVLVGSIAHAASRIWKSSNGRFSVEAELLDFKDGKAQLQKKDGTVIEVPLVSLCEEDRRYVKSQFPGVEEEKLAPGAEYREWKTQERQVQHRRRVPRLRRGQSPTAETRRQRDFRRSRRAAQCGRSALDRRRTPPPARGGEEGGQIERQGRARRVAGKIDESEIRDEAGAAGSAQADAARPKITAPRRLPIFSARSPRSSSS